MNYNLVVIVGRLTKDPVFRDQKDSKMAQFSLAVNRYKKDGEPQADFIPVVFWGDSAIRASEWLKRGDLCLIQGRVTVRSYEKDGQTCWFTEVVGDSFRLMTPKPADPDGVVERVVAP
ncbi:single-stranded DNA-binding protein [bacterium]|nr:single-stranded DNA-binding protein [bacterium]|tara:strand:+ start:1904 stop:2257 length:354 start_codon:yes stop_codon:yes gene_type:complete